eukprot:RCo010815
MEFFGKVPLQSTRWLLTTNGEKWSPIDLSENAQAGGRDQWTGDSPMAAPTIADLGETGIPRRGGRPTAKQPHEKTTRHKVTRGTDTEPGSPGRQPSDAGQGTSFKRGCGAVSVFLAFTPRVTRCLIPVLSLPNTTHSQTHARARPPARQISLSEESEAHCASPTHVLCEKPAKSYDMDGALARELFDYFSANGGRSANGFQPMAGITPSSFWKYTKRELCASKEDRKGRRRRGKLYGKLERRLLGATEQRTGRSDWAATEKQKKVHVTRHIRSVGPVPLGRGGGEGSAEEVYRQGAKERLQS